MNPLSWSKVPCLRSNARKKGAQNDKKNYRPINILSCMGRLFTSILNNRLYTLSEELNAICQNQAGFRKGYSTVDNIFLMVACVCTSGLKCLYSLVNYF